MSGNKIGSVTLLGAGCGRGLMTCRGMDLLRKADVIVYDDLLDTALLAERRPGSKLIYVGKRFSRHSKKQEEISEILIREAEKGQKVLRLKGGDSFVFGRGGEEVLALQAARVPYQVIPGISSGIAVPEHLGIPVTHRGLAQSVTFITGHSASDLQENYRALAGLQGTLVFFMGLNHAARIAEELIACGKDPETPAAILSCGFRANEKRVDGRLKDMEAMAMASETPALILVGNVAEFHMESTLDLPLKGTSVTVTGTRHFTDRLEKKLISQGAFVNKCPCIEIRPDSDQIPTDFSAYSWLIFTSSNGIEVFFKTLLQRQTDLRALMHVKFACIGSGTAEKLKSYGFHADFVPSDYTAQCLGKELTERLTSADHLLILRAENGSPLLNEELDKAGAFYKDCKIYHTGAFEEDLVINQAEEQANYIVFGSSMGAKAYLQQHQLQEGTKIVCIGEQTAAALAGRPVLMPQEHTAEQIVKLILEDKKNETLSQTSYQ